MKDINEKTVKKPTTRTPKKTTGPKVSKLADNITTEATINLNEIDPEAVIPCMSLVNGRLVRVGKETRTVYIWQNLGDIENVTYKDLRREMNSNGSHTIYKGPDIYILDPKVYEKNERLKKIYDELYDPRQIRPMIEDGNIDLITGLIDSASPSQITMIKSVVADIIRDGGASSLRYGVVNMLNEKLGTSYDLIM